MNITNGLYICSSNITLAWIEAVSLLKSQPKREIFNLAVRIKDPTSESAPHRKIIESFIENNSNKLHQGFIETVAQTIFPKSLLYKSCPQPELPEHRQQFYHRYIKNKEIIRAHNLKGTYFQRLIWWPLWDTTQSNRINQLENIIDKINGGKASRVVHELALINPLADAEGIDGAMFYNPDKDRNCSQYMSFPCLSYISIKPESVKKKCGKIHMTAVYRNHYFISKAYGNYLGLGWLLEFISNATGRYPGELLCVSSMARLEAPPDGLSNGKVNELLEKLKITEAH